MRNCTSWLLLLLIAACFSYNLRHVQLLDERLSTTEKERRDLGGEVCRFTGYLNVVHFGEHLYCRRHRLVLPIFSEHTEQGLHILWQGGFEFHHFFSGGVFEFER